MSDGFYDGGRNRRTYTFPAADLSSAAVFGRFQGPAGLVGRVRGIEYVLTTGVTVAAALVTVGNNGAVGPASMSVEVAAINTGGAQTAAERKANGAEVVAGVNDVELAADTVVECASDGGATAGAGDITITVDWF